MSDYHLGQSGLWAGTVEQDMPGKSVAWDAVRPIVERAGSHGSANLVLVWRIGCSTSRLALPFFERMAAAYPKAAVHSICQDRQDEVDAYQRERGSSHRTWSDTGLEVSRALGVSIVPAYWLFGPSGEEVIAGKAWDRLLIEDIGRQLARLTEAEEQPVVLEADDVPDFKPG